MSHCCCNVHRSPAINALEDVVDVNLHPILNKHAQETNTISVPSITFDGSDDGVRPPATAAQHARFFTGPRAHHIVPGAGHNLPQEKPQLFADAVLELIQQGLAS